MKNQIQKIIQEYKSLGIQQQLDYDKFYLYSIITHSTAIEGSTVTEIENQLLFDEGISANNPMNEQLMNLDLKKAYEQSFVYAASHTNSQSQDEESSAKFIDFMMEHHCENLIHQIEEYKKSIDSEGGQKIKGGQKKWSETTQKIYELIKTKPGITRKELCENLGINPSAVQKHIEKLKKENAIKRSGGDKGGWWEIL